MPNERDGQHAGGSIVDTTRANTSPEQINKDNQTHDRKEQADRDGKKDKP